MIKLNFFLILLIPLYVHSQFSDDFNDGDFTSNPRWFGDTARYQVDTAARLQLIDTTAGSSFIVVSSEALVNARWDFWIRLEFNPSASNLARIYLVSDQWELDAPLNGYYIEVGGSNDEVSLFRQDGSSRTKLIDGKDDRVSQSTVLVRIAVERDDPGNWELMVDTAGGNNYVSEGTAFHSQLIPYSYFGVYCKYTTTRSDKFFFDDFEVQGSPFADTATAGARIHEVVINEIMFLPEPVYGLPPVEYIELYNRSKETFSLAGWTFSDATTSVTIGPYLFTPGSYALLCHEDDAPLMETYGEVVGLPSFPSLNNSGDSLTLKNERGQVIHFVAYSPEWFQSDLKDNGGFSIEMIDPHNPCQGSTNWKASKNDRGGTPGTNNSIRGLNPDLTHPELKRIRYVDSMTIDAIFNEPLDSQTVADYGHFITAPDLGKPQEVTLIPPVFNRIRLKFPQPMEHHLIYKLQTEHITDCYGNPSVLFNHGIFGRPEPIDVGDIVINEVLFNPWSGGYDFVELYNRSDKIIDLNTLYLFEAVIDEPDSLLEESHLGDENLLSFPGDHTVATKDFSTLNQFYHVPHKNQVIEIDHMPNYPDDEGNVILYNYGIGMVDALQYDENWHFQLLVDQNGISLERLNPDGITQDANNWHSAASTVGNATPTYSNSQMQKAGESGAFLSIHPKVITPDQDGVDDYTQIQYNLDATDYVGNIQIFDMAGRLVVHLVKNHLLGRKGSFSWDGLTEGGEKVGIGIYIIYFEAFRGSGEVKKFIENIVIGGKF